MRVGISREGSRVVLAMRHESGASATAVMKRAQAASFDACLSTAVNADDDTELELELRAGFTTHQGTRP